MFQNSSMWLDLQAFVDKSIFGNFLSVGGRLGTFLMDDPHANGRPSYKGRPSYVRIIFLIWMTLMDELELVQFFSSPLVAPLSKGHPEYCRIYFCFLDACLYISG